MWTKEVADGRSKKNIGVEYAVVTAWNCENKS